MNDERFIFAEDVRHRKQTAHGANHKVRGGGKRVKMPSDYMTKKEILAMSGNCNTYNLSMPMKWGEFKAMPKDIQVEYVSGLISKYYANATWIAGMMGISYQTLRVWAKNTGFKWPYINGYWARNAKPAWDAFVNGGEEKAEEREAVKEEKAEAKKEVKVEAETSNIAAILALLVGTGAKLTIEVTL